MWIFCKNVILLTIFGKQDIFPSRKERFSFAVFSRLLLCNICPKSCFSGEKARFLSEQILKENAQ